MYAACRFNFQDPHQIARNSLSSQSEGFAMFRRSQSLLFIVALVVFHLHGSPPSTKQTEAKQPEKPADGAPLMAGVAKVDITNTKLLPVYDRLYVKALVLKSGNTMAAIITVDAVAIGGIGYIRNDYLGKVRGRL